MAGVAGVGEVRYMLCFLCMFHIYVYATGMDRGQRLGATDDQVRDMYFSRKFMPRPWSACGMWKMRFNCCPTRGHGRRSLPTENLFTTTDCIADVLRAALGPVIVIHWSSCMLRAAFTACFAPVIGLVHDLAYWSEL